MKRVDNLKLEETTGWGMLPQNGGKYVDVPFVCESCGAVGMYIEVGRIYVKAEDIALPALCIRCGHKGIISIRQFIYNHLPKRRRKKSGEG